MVGSCEALAVFPVGLRGCPSPSPALSWALFPHTIPLAQKKNTVIPTPNRNAPNVLPMMMPVVSPPKGEKLELEAAPPPPPPPPPPGMGVGEGEGLGPEVGEAEGKVTVGHTLGLLGLSMNVPEKRLTA